MIYSHSKFMEMRHLSAGDERQHFSVEDPFPPIAVGHLNASRRPFSAINEDPFQARALPTNNMAKYPFDWNN